MKIPLRTPHITVGAYPGPDGSVMLKVDCTDRAVAHEASIHAQLLPAQVHALISALRQALGT